MLSRRGLIAIADQVRVADGGTTLDSSANPTQTLQALYSLPASDFHDNLGGYNGTTTADLTNPSVYNEVTGLGSPVANLLVPDLAHSGLTPTVEFSSASETINETTGNFSITVELSWTSTQNVSVPFTVGGTALNGTDYSGLTAGPLVIPAGSTSITISGTMLAGSRVEQDLDFHPAHSEPRHAGDRAAGNTLTITEPESFTVSNLNDSGAGQPAAGDSQQQRHGRNEHDCFFRSGGQRHDYSRLRPCRLSPAM